MALIKRLISSSKYGIKCPYTMKAQGICIHNTANDASASNEISYMQNNNNEVSYHIAVDDKEAIQGLPLERNAWHAGDGGSGTGNRNYIAVEICYSKSGGDKFVKAEKRAAMEVAALLKERNWGVDKVRDHRSFSGKNCPHRTNMVDFKYLVQVELNKLGQTQPPKPTVDEDKIIKEYSEKGYGIPRCTVNVRNKPSTIGNTPVATYVKNEKINLYDRVVITESYVWISYMSTSGVRRYVAVKDQKTGERFVDCY